MGGFYESFDWKVLIFMVVFVFKIMGGWFNCDCILSCWCDMNF